MLSLRLWSSSRERRNISVCEEGGRICRKGEIKASSRSREDQLVQVFFWEELMSLFGLWGFLCVFFGGFCGGFLFAFVLGLFFFLREEGHGVEKVKTSMNVVECQN